jgi:hypothetical protein
VTIPTSRGDIEMTHEIKAAEEALGRGLLRVNPPAAERRSSNPFYSGNQSLPRFAQDPMTATISLTIRTSPA